MKRNLKMAIIAALIIAVFAVSFISCTKGDTTAGAATGLKTIVPGVLTVGSDCTWPPMEYIEGDKIVGFDVDLTQAIADRIGLKLDYQNTAWDGLFPALIAGKFDMAISSITITDDRKKEMDFSDPYYQTDQAAAVKKDSGIDSADKLNGKKAGVQIGTTGEIEAREIEGLEVKTYDDILLAFEDLKAGRVDAVIADSYMCFAYVKNNEGLDVGFSIITDEQLGIAFAKNSPDLLAAVNSALKSIKEDGTYDKIHAKWFGEK
ncbi:MAG: basic amino acid ABC transporter substrate-binding protein [Actinobacteria bacterium]|nr:basic amino acid ABC transporter substrate-binding protein [Actinomycetota bacterium]